MPVEFVDRFNNAMATDQAYKLFVFGDNLQRAGRAGQAIIRGCENAIGLPTKRAPCMDEHCFLTDSDLAIVLKASSADIDTLFLAIGHNVTIVWPKAGIGTGLAQLSQRAPLIKKFYDDLLEDLQKPA